MFPYNFTPPYDNTQVTVELRQIVESGVDVWAFDYPSYYSGDEKKAFEKKVLDHYWVRQIGQETVGRWLHYFRSRMREIMPYYIQLYESQALMQGIEDPFGNVDIVETYEETRTEKSTGKLDSQTSGTSETENTGTSSGTDTTTETKQDLNQHKFSNTPQGAITNLEYYMTEASIDNNQSEVNQEKTSTSQTGATSSGTATGSQTDTTEGELEGSTRHTFTKKGNQGVNTYAHDMKELRETFLNIDMQVINELKDLFLQVY